MDFIKNLGDKEAQAFIENNKELVILDVEDIMNLKQVIYLILLIFL